jgi:hypothetical protein
VGRVSWKAIAPEFNLKYQEWPQSLLLKTSII